MSYIAVNVVVVLQLIVKTTEIGFFFFFFFSFLFFGPGNQCFLNNPKTITGVNGTNKNFKTPNST